MNEIDGYLDRVCGGLRGSASLRGHVRGELREHLLAAVESRRAAGATEDEAVAQAIEDFGDPDMVREGLEAIYGRRLVGLLVEKAMAWKERTMKSDWKWRFGTHGVLALILGIQIVLVEGTGMLIFPLIIQHGTTGVALPDIGHVAIRLLSGLHEFWFAWLSVLVVGWALFEWRCRSESKPAIRLAAGALAALAGTVLVGVVMTAALLPWAQVSGLLRLRQNEPLIRGAAEEASRSFAELSRTMEVDRQQAEEAARGLSRKFQFLDRSDLAAPSLAVLDEFGTVEEIRRLLRDLAEQSNDVYHNIRRKREAETQEHFARLKESYQRLTAVVPGWPAAASTQPAPTE